jgi:hypothetical protein
VIEATNRPNHVDALVAFLVVLISGNPVVLALYPRAVFVAALLVLVCIAFVRGIHTVRSADLVLVAAFASLSIFHLATFSTTVISASAGFWVRLLIALLAVRVVDQFHLRYTKVMYLLALLSLCFYGAQQLLGMVGVDLRIALSNYSFLSDGRVHIGVHNFHFADEAHRNSGMFWEPGAFAGYLGLALLLLAAHQDQYSRAAYKRILWVLAIAIATTMSAAGYLLLPLVVAMHIRPRFATFSAPLRAISIALVLGLGVAMLTTILYPFISEKVMHQFESTLEGAEGAELTRFGSVIYDLEFIRSRPIAGWSPHPVTRTTLDSFSADILTGQGNGFTGFIVKFGLIGLALFAVASYLTFAGLFGTGTIRPLVATLLVLAMLNGEAFLNYPVMMTLMFRPWTWRPLPQWHRTSNRVRTAADLGT